MNFLSLLGQSSYYNTDPYYYSTNSLTQAESAAAAGVFMGMMVFGLIVMVIAYVITAVLLGRIFKKAGIESWKAWVPIYSSWVFLELGGQKGFWAVLTIVPVVQIVAVVFFYIAMYEIGVKFGKEGWFILIGIFLPIVWYAWLAFDHSTWKGYVVAIPTNSVPPQPTMTPPTPPTTPAM